MKCSTPSVIYYQLEEPILSKKPRLTDSSLVMQHDIRVDNIHSAKP